MPLSGYPLNTKYTPTDQVYIFLEGKLLPVTITEWRTTVIADPNDSEVGIQQVWYRFAEVSGEYNEVQVFSSPNHAKSYVTGSFFNQAILSGSGGNFCFLAGAQSGAEPGDANWVDFGSWSDFAGFELTGINWTNASDFGDVEEDWELDWENAIFDNTRLGYPGLMPEPGDEPLMPEHVDTREKFIAVVKSYDAESTIWPDGDPVGRPE